MKARYILAGTALLAGLASVARADLFFETEVLERSPYSEFEKWHLVYRNNTTTERVLHMQVDNQSCSVDGVGVMVQVRDGGGSLVEQQNVPGYEAAMLSLYVPANGRVRAIFRGNTAGGTSFNQCSSAYPKAYYQLSEPTPR